MIGSQMKLQARLGPGTRAFLPLLESETEADVVLTCRDGERVRCHSYFLAARSSYFRKLFRDMRGGEEKELPQLLVSRACVMQILRFLYSDFVVFRTEDSECLRELLFLSVSWKLHALIALFGRMAKNDASGGGNVAVTNIWRDLRNSLTLVPTDCVLEAEGVSFAAHKIVLFQAGFFRTMFGGRFLEAVTPNAVVKLGQMSSQQLECVLGVCYDGALPPHTPLSLVTSLISLSGYLQFDALKKEAEKAVTDIDERNFAEVFDLAVESRLKDLQKLVVEFVEEHFDTLEVSVFCRIPKELLRRVLNAGNLLLDEGVIFDRLIRWGLTQLQRPQPESTIGIQICSDPELRACLEELLPPRVLFTKRNKKALLGMDPFSIHELVY